MRSLRSFAVASALLSLGLPPCAADPVDPDRVITETLAQAGEEISKQCQALVRLAWPDAPGVAPEISARARAELVAFGERAITTLRISVRKVKPQYQADLVRTYIEAFRQMSSRMPPDYLAGLEEAVWFGSEEAKRIAVPELARFRYRPALLTIIDAAHEVPALNQVCIEALGRIGDERARFFLEKALNDGTPGAAEAAAVSLAQIGGRALLPLKAALRADSRLVRLSAARALLPVARVEDLSSLFEYLEEHSRDDPGTSEAIRQAAIMLDKQRQAQEASAAASSAPEEKTP